MNKLYIFGIMKKCISLLLVLAFVVTANAQQFPNPDLTYGKEFRRLMPDSTLYLPTGCGAPSGTASLKSTVTNKAAKYYDSCAALEYTYNPKTQSWAISGSGGHASNADSLNHQAPAYYLAWANFTGIPTFYYQTVKGNGTSATQRPAINFGSQFTVADNSGSNRTDITISALDASITTTGIFSISRLDTTHTGTGLATYQYMKWKVDSLGTISSSVYKFASDTFFNTGYTTRARLKQLTDSLSGTINYSNWNSAYSSSPVSVAFSASTFTITQQTGSLSVSVPTFNQNTTGSAAKWTTGRTLAITGDLTYTSPSLDGSGNVTAAGTLATVNSNIGTFNTVTVNAKGLVTAASNTAYTTLSGTGFVQMSGTTVTYVPTISAANGGTGVTSLSALAANSAFTGTYVTYTGANANVNIGSNSFTAGAISSNVSSGNNINIDKSGGGEINFTRSGVQHFLLEDDTNGIGFYYGSTPTLGTTIGQNINTSGSVTGQAVSFTTGAFSGQITSLSGIQSKTGASNTIGVGSFFGWDNGLTSTSQRALGLQMNASFGLDYWYYTGSSWAQTGLHLNNDGSINATTGAFSGNITLGSLSGSQTTPDKLTFSNSYATTVNDASLKIYLYDGGAGSRYGLGVGSASDINYWTATSSGTHNFYVNGSKSLIVNNTGVISNSFVKVSGTSSQFLKADGSVDATVYLTASNNYYDLTGSSTTTGTHTFGYNTTNGNYYKNANGGGTYAHSFYSNGGGIILQLFETPINGYNGSTGGFVFGGAVNLKAYTVATLPTGNVGDICYVTDALSPTYNTTIIGGGAIKTLVFYNGTNWTAH